MEEENNTKAAYIDFTTIGDYDDFYNQLKTKIDLPEDFGNNLDALYDSISGYTYLPLDLYFYDLSVLQLEQFSDLLQTLEDADEDVEGFQFKYYVEQYDQ